MSADKLRQSFSNLGRALDRLGETQEESPGENPFLIDATIQRFEFCLELYWKALTRLLAYEGIEAATPRATFKHAFQQGWRHDEGCWLDMLDDRNKTSHVYSEQAAQEIFTRIRGYLPEMRRTFETLRQQYASVVGQL